MPRRGDSVRSLARALAQQAEGWQAWGVQGAPTSRGPSGADERIDAAAPPIAGPARTGPARSLAELEQEVIACRACPLYRTRTHHVFSDGDPHARLVFVGEAPGRQEDLEGKPFVGAAGQLLTKMIEAIGLRREQVYICNVLKDRPPENRTPLPEEVEACRPYLLRQLELIGPKVICVLGAVAAKALLGPETSITKVRGRPHEFLGAVLIPTFHPAYLLRNPPAKKFAWQDLKKVKKLLNAECGVRNAE